MSPNVTQGEGGGAKKYRKSVTYYLNGPLHYKLYYKRDFKDFFPS
jgi:hypothetical protein